jgi:predicted acyl esterase
MREAPVVVHPRSPKGNLPAESYPTTTPRARQRLYLSTGTKPALLPQNAVTTTLTTASGTGTATLHQGVNAIVHTALPMLVYAQDAWIGVPANVALPLVDPKVTRLWTGAKLSSTLKLRGEVTAHLTLTPSAADGTVVVHVLDVSGTTGYLVAHQAYSWSGRTPGTPFTADLTVPYNAFDLPAGHRLAIAVTTNDPTFSDANPRNATVRVGPQSWVDVPLR